MEEYSAELLRAKICQCELTSSLLAIPVTDCWPDPEPYLTSWECNRIGSATFCIFNTEPKVIGSSSFALAKMKNNEPKMMANRGMKIDHNFCIFKNKKLLNYAPMDELSLFLCNSFSKGIPSIKNHFNFNKPKMPQAF